MCRANALFSFHAYFYTAFTDPCVHSPTIATEGFRDGGGGEPTGICAKDQSFIYGPGEVRPSVRPSVLFFPLPCTSLSLARPLTRAVFRARDGPNTSPVDTRQQYITRPTVQTGASFTAPFLRFSSTSCTYIYTSALIPAAAVAYFHICM